MQDDVLDEATTEKIRIAYEECERGEYHTLEEVVQKMRERAAELQDEH